MTALNGTQIWEKHFGNVHSVGIVQNPKLEEFFDELTTETMKSDIGKTIEFRKVRLQNDVIELTGIVTGAKDKCYIVDVSGTTYFVPQNAIIELC